MIVVSDTSPVRALYHLGLLELLRHFFGEILIPPAVDRELRSASSRFPRINFDEFDFLRVQPPHDQEQVRRFLESLDPGESEALALALEEKADALLIDETAGRATALRLGLRPVGTLGLLIRGKREGRVDAVEQALHRLETELGFFISAQLRADVLRRAGE